MSDNLESSPQAPGEKTRAMIPEVTLTNNTDGGRIDIDPARNYFIPSHTRPLHPSEVAFIALTHATNQQARGEGVVPIIPLPERDDARRPDMGEMLKKYDII